MRSINWKKDFLENLTPTDAAKFERDTTKEITVAKGSRGVDLDYLIDWYMASVDETETPIWTEEHLKELLKDFIIIPKNND